jgi:hypothetical protein
VFMFLAISHFTFPLDWKKLLFFWLKIARLDLDKNLTWNICTLTYVLQHILYVKLFKNLFFFILTPVFKITRLVYVKWKFKMAEVCWVKWNVNRVCDVIFVKRAWIDMVKSYPIALRWRVVFLNNDGLSYWSYCTNFTCRRNFCKKSSEYLQSNFGRWIRETP